MNECRVALMLPVDAVGRSCRVFSPRCLTAPSAPLRSGHPEEHRMIIISLWNAKWTIRQESTHFLISSYIQAKLGYLAGQGIAPVSQELGRLLPASAGDSKGSGNQNPLGGLDGFLGNIDMTELELLIHPAT